MKLTLIAAALFCMIRCAGQAATDIYLFDLKIETGQVTISNGKNITPHKGYDNQPYFHPEKTLIYYSSFNDSGRSDIKYYDFLSGVTINLTLTHDREYSPTVTPDQKFISCIVQRDNGAQDLVKYPIDGGKPETLVWHLKVGYHAWAGLNKVFLFVLDDSTHNSLHNYDLSTNSDTVVAENIGRSLHAVPGEYALAYVQKLNDKLSVIKKIDISTKVSSPVIYTLPGQDFFCITQPTSNLNRVYLAADASGLHFFREDPFSEFKDRKWLPVTVIGNSNMLKGVTRLAVNSTNDKLAVVVSE